MPIFRPLTAYAIKNDPNIIADVTIYQENKMVHHQVIVKNKKAFYNNHTSFVKNNILTLDEI